MKDVADKEGSGEVNDELSIAQRVDLSIAFGRYIGCSQKLESLWEEKRAASGRVKDILGPCSRVVVKVDYAYYIVTTDEDGELDVKPIQVVG
jgi:hypothetical protein